MKDGLKKYAKEQGEVSVRGGKWTFDKSEPSPKTPIFVVKQYAEKPNHNEEVKINDKLDIIERVEIFDQEELIYFVELIDYYKDEAISDSLFEVDVTN